MTTPNFIILDIFFYSSIKAIQLKYFGFVLYLRANLFIWIDTGDTERLEF